MSKKILITGGSGLIGQALTSLLLSKGYKVAHLGRNKKSGLQKYKVSTYHWDIEQKTVDSEAFKGTHAIVHLAGAGVMDKPWTESYKREIIDSRVKSTELLYASLSHAAALESFITASAIGIYGADTGSAWIDEQSLPANDFLAKVVRQWEQTANSFEVSGYRTIKIRIGIVLSTHGGALPKLLQPIKLGFGSPIGSGKQYISWIHIEDLARLFLYGIENAPLQGVFNGVAPNPVTNADFTKMAAMVLNKPLWAPSVPSLVIKTLLGAEKAKSILGGNRVSSNKIEREGFTFMFKELPTALKDLLP